MLWDGDDVALLLLVGDPVRDLVDHEAVVGVDAEGVHAGDPVVAAAGGDALILDAHDEVGGDLFGGVGDVLELVLAVKLSPRQ